MFNILITGVGGQGVITLAEIISNSALLAGLDVRMAEIHGLAQRGGHLECSVKIGKAIRSPLIGRGEVDLLIALEPLEAVRSIGFLSENSTVIFDTHKIIPISVYSDKINYPRMEEINKQLGKIAEKVFSVDGTEATMRVAGSVMPLNIFMIGAVFYKNVLPKEFTADILLQSIKEVIGEKHFEANKKVFESAK
jgi:indolepyruvate ferredoxin oxidoreductase beta subunit